MRIGVHYREVLIMVLDLKSPFVQCHHDQTTSTGCKLEESMSLTPLSFTVANRCLSGDMWISRTEF